MDAKTDMTESAGWPPGALTFSMASVMRGLLCALLLLLTPEAAFGSGYIACFNTSSGDKCLYAVNSPTDPIAERQVSARCEAEYGPAPCTNPILQRNFAQQCIAVFSNLHGSLTSDIESDLTPATKHSYDACASLAGSAPCEPLAQVCDTAGSLSTSAPAYVPATSTPAKSQLSEIDWGAIFQAIAEFEADVTFAAVVINLVLFLGLFKIIAAHKQRIYILGVLTLASALFSFGLPYLESFFGLLALYVIGTIIHILQRIATVGMYVAGIPFAALLVSKYAPSLCPDLFDQGLPETLRVTSKQIEVVISRSQRFNWLNRVVFMVDARMGMSIEQYSLMRKYRLGRTIVFDSARRERQNELARTHLELAREGKSQTICLWREEWRGIFRRLWYLIRALVSLLLGFLFIRVTLAKLIKGAHVESKSLDKILAAKNAIERSASDLKAYLEVAETFDGREDLFEPS